MIAPRLLVRFRDREYGITQLGEAWVIEVDGGKYFLTADDGEHADRAARRFIDARMRNSDHRPALLASQRYPLLMSIDGRLVRAWPSFVPRGTGASSYINPATGERVATVKDAVYWILAARGRETSPAGSVTTEQAIEDIEDLARIWLRMAQ